MSQFYRPAIRPRPSGLVLLASVRKRARACLECLREFEINPCHANGHRYCSAACRAKARRRSMEEEGKACGRRKSDAPELERLRRAAIKILGRLQDGPALAAELVAAGGGYRYGQRLAELRARGHKIRSENLGDGIWRYTLVQP